MENNVQKETMSEVEKALKERLDGELEKCLNSLKTNFDKYTERLQEEHETLIKMVSDLQIKDATFFELLAKTRGNIRIFNMKKESPSEHITVVVDGRYLEQDAYSQIVNNSDKYKIILMVIDDNKFQLK